MNFIIWIIFGALVGWIASMIMGTNARQGAIMNVIFGIAGALLGGWVMAFFGAPGVSGLNLYSFIVALVGAVILIAIAQAFRRRTA